MKQRGTDPIIDEEVILACLDQSECESQHASGNLMALIDAWDRKLTRDQFIALASAVVTCADNIGRHSMMHSMKTFLVSHKYDVAPADVEAALGRTSGYLKRSTTNVREMAALMSQMARAEDPVH